MSQDKSPSQPRRGSSVQASDMSSGDSPRRAARARTAVTTYNLKALTRIAGQSHLQNQPKDNMPVSLGSQSHLRSKRPRSASRPATAIGKSSQNKRPSSRLNSHMSSTEDIPVVGGPYIARSAEPAAADADSGENIYDCFNTQSHPKGHYYSALDLHKRGVWIGYLAPDRHGESFHGLPSFNNLKANCENMEHPYPPPINGLAGQGFTAVCRGCTSESSAIIEFIEIQYVRDTKLVIMPLDGDDQDGVFCIMIAQSSDSTLMSIQPYRPYEITGEGDGKAFTNRIMILAPRIRDHDPAVGALEIVLEALPLKERQNIAESLKRSRAMSRSRSAFPSTTKAPKRQTRPPVKRSDGQNDGGPQDNGPSAQKRRKTNDVDSPESASEKKEESSLTFDRPSATKTSTTRIEQVAPMSHGPSVSPPQAGRNPASAKVSSLGVTREQATRIQFIWRTTDNDIETEFTHTLGECKTFKGLLALLEEEAEEIPSASDVLAKTKVWRMTYKLGDAAKKANIVRRGTETSFDRLQTALTSSSFLSDNPRALLEVEITPLN